MGSYKSAKIVERIKELTLESIKLLLFLFLKLLFQSLHMRSSQQVHLGRFFPLQLGKRLKKDALVVRIKGVFFLARTIRRSSWTISILSSVIFLKRIEYQKILPSVVGRIVYSLSIDMLDNLPIIKLHSNYVIS